MPSTSNSVIGNNDELSDFFGGAWDYNANSTFSDFPLDNCWEMPDVTKSGVDVPVQEENLRITHTGGVTAMATKQPNPTSPPSSSSSFTTQANKPKLPNLYETLRQTQMVPHLVLSPMGGYGDVMAGLDWTPPQPMIPAIDRGSAAAYFNTSPPGVMDASQYLFMHSMKRPRISPILTSAGSEQVMAGGMVPFGSSMLWPPNLFQQRRPAKMPLSPVNKPEKKFTPPGDIHDKGPIVLPFITQQSNGPQKAVKPPMKLLPAHTGAATVAPVTQIHPENKARTIATLEENIEKNLRSFLRETKDLQWENVTVIELKRILRQYELNATGKKAELMARIEKIRRSYKHLEEDIRDFERPPIV